jgi:hypothetical protein
MSGGIFISYRHDDSAGWALRIYDRLTERFGRDQVFIDVGNIEPGLDFVKILSDNVGNCDALVAIIGKDWLGRKRRGTRLDDPNDFVRIEIEAALTRNVRVIPVLVDGATMAQAEVLPEALRPLVRRQKVDVSPVSFESDAQRLINALAFVEAERQKRDVAKPERIAMGPALQSEAQSCEYDAFICYNPRDATKLAHWIRRKLQKFQIPSKILEDLPLEIQLLYVRKPRIYLDTSYDSSNDNFLIHKVIPALDHSRRLIVISTPSAFEKIADSDGASQDNWLVREVEHFLQSSRPDLSTRPIVLVLGPGAPTKRTPAV